MNLKENWKGIYE